MPTWYLAGTERYRGPAPVAAVTGYQGPGDIVGNWVFWHGLRAFSNAAIGQNVVDLVRNDAATLTVATVAGGGLDPAVVTWMSGHTATIAKLYDQSGGGLHLDVVNFSVVNQPAFTLAAVGSFPGAVFTAAGANSSYLVSVPNGPTLSQPFSLDVVAANSTVGAVNGAMITLDVANASNITIAYDGPTSTTSWLAFAGSGIDGTVSSAGGFHTALVMFSGASSKLLLDGALTSGNAGTSAPASLGLTAWGCLNNGGGIVWPLTGTILEGGLNSTDISGVASALNSNQHTYYGF